MNVNVNQSSDGSLRKLTEISPAFLYSPRRRKATNSLRNNFVPITFPIASQSSHSTPSAQLTGMKIFPRINSIPMSLYPSRKVIHLTVASAKAKNAINPTRFAMMLRINAIPFFAPFEAASRIEESDLKVKVKI